MLSTALLMAALMAVGQAEKASPLPEDVAAHLQYLIGTWEVKAKIGEATVAGTYTVRWAPGRHCALITYATAPGQPEEVSGEMSGILGYDAANKRTIEKNFWTTGAHYTTCYDISNPVKGKGIIEGELAGVDELIGTDQGKEFKCAVKVERKGRGEFVYMSKTVDGEPVEAVFLKVKRPGRKKSQPKSE